MKHVLVAKWFTNQIPVLIVQDCVLVRGNMYLETESLILLFLWFGVFQLFVGVLGVWSRKSCLGPAEIASFVFLVLFKDGGCRVSLRFHLFVSGVNQGNEEAIQEEAI